MNGLAVDQIRREANTKLDPNKKSELGQFMTPFRIAEFMAGLFDGPAKKAVLLDAGAGVGSLAIAAVHVLKNVSVEAWEIDSIMRQYLESNMEKLGAAHEIHGKDFIHEAVMNLTLNQGSRFTHAILNPPYKKIRTDSPYRRLLRKVGIETVNLYTAFLALAILLMKQGGQIVAIVPRSFCNGPYYKPFRAFLLSKCSIKHIHVFESRNKAFKDDEVLQENIILKLVRGGTQNSVTLSCSHDAQLSDYSERRTGFSQIVKPVDKELFIHIPGEGVEQGAGNLFSHTLVQLGLQVSTGPVVDFRVKEYWKDELKPNSVPLLYPHHFTEDGFRFPCIHKKPNALARSKEVDKWLMPKGFYVIVKRFSAKEERRRVVAYIIGPGDIPTSLVGFENHWNVFHANKRGIDETMAKGIACFLNSTVLDKHFRMFSGHTQVNATDLRNIKYPSLDQIRVLGAAYANNLPQEKIDSLVASLGHE